jgi:protein-disulfide isomerase
VKGSLAARIAIIQYSNFECRHCRAFARGSFKALAAKHLGTGQALLAFRHLPGPDRPSERSSAEAAECARRQGRFWEMHDHLFDGVPSPSRTQLSSYAGEVGLELDQFEKCMSGEAEAHVQADVAMAREIGITGAPAFLVGLLQSDGRVGVKRIMRGNHSIAVFDEIIRLLRERSTRSPEGLTGVLWGARR